MKAQHKRLALTLAMLALAACGDGDEPPERPSNGMMDAGSFDAGNMDARIPEGGTPDAS